MMNGEPTQDHGLDEEHRQDAADGPAGPPPVRQDGTAEPQVRGKDERDDRHERCPPEVPAAGHHSPTGCLGCARNCGGLRVGGLRGSLRRLPVHLESVASPEPLDVPGDEDLKPPQVLFVGGFDPQRQAARGGPEGGLPPGQADVPRTPPT